MAIRGYRDLQVWQKGMDLVIACYAVTRSFPRSEQYGLTSQLTRAAVSIPANIAEGRARPHVKEFLQFLGIACGSLAELETHLEIAGRLEFIKPAALEDLLNQTDVLGRMLNGLQASLKRRSST